MYTFIGHDNWKGRFPLYNLDFKVITEDKKVTVLRSLLFFYSEEKTTLSRIKLHFTDHAIQKLVHDKFIEIHNE